ncbi:MAG: hypothetical protein ACQES9_11385 [Myxococcota bacterium]
MLNSKFKFFTIFFMLSTAFVLSTGCKKGEASCKGIWDKFHECSSDKEKKQIKGLLGSKDDFMKRCEKVKDDKDVKNIMKAAAEGCEEFKGSFKENKETMMKLTTLGEKMKEAKDKMKKMKAKKDAKKKEVKKEVKKEDKKEDKKEEKKEEEKKEEKK